MQRQLGHENEGRTRRAVRGRGIVKRFGDVIALDGVDLDVHTGQIVPVAMRSLAAQWTRWQAQQHLTGPGAQPDYANNEQMNRFTWYQTHNWSKPYPGDATILSPDHVPGAYFGSTEGN